ncbi:MAG: Unknown protein [uncultured Sulfurovum sp.]|uniref:Lipoprotein n=1 Tax=uncultured Sulfurovum sp. TaxID=269237 RepID=A0A6S6TL88_9BACT|nr:MAG: Unknown protein [uncultured Sulfurovum sp.]
MRQTLGILIVAGLITGCVPAPKPTVGLGTGIGTRIGTAEGSNSAYGVSPLRYQNAIKNYFSSKLTRGEQGKYKFAEPKRAYKQKGLAYGGDLAWKGWLVETSVSTPSRTGRYLTPKPYMVLFKGEQIVEHILGNSHKLLTKVDP